MPPIFSRAAALQRVRNALRTHPLRQGRPQVRIVGRKVVGGFAGRTLAVAYF